jgi:hypothetical protein
MPDSSDEFVIVGTNAEGKPFRPGDWAERLCGVLAEFGGDERLEYSRHVHPTTIDGVTAVVVGAGLRKLEPKAYRFVVNFAKDNELQVISGRPRTGARAAGKRTGAKRHAAQGGR